MMPLLYSIMAGLTLVVGGMSVVYVGNWWPMAPEYAQYPALGGTLIQIGETSFWLGLAVLIIPQIFLLLGQIMPHPTAEQDAAQIIDRLGLRKEYRPKNTAQKKGE